MRVGRKSRRSLRRPLRSRPRGSGDPRTRRRGRARKRMRQQKQVAVRVRHYVTDSGSLRMVACASQHGPPLGALVLCGPGERPTEGHAHARSGRARAVPGGVLETPPPPRESGSLLSCRWNESSSSWVSRKRATPTVQSGRLGRRRLHFRMECSRQRRRPEDTPSASEPLRRSRGRRSAARSCP
jgi:hypothetical protein